MATDATLAERAKAKGWPDGLLDRALAIRTPDRQLDGWLRAEPNATFLFNVEKTIAVFERLASGPYRGRELTGWDGEAFTDLWANAPEPVGDWSVTVERAPNPIAQFSLQPGATISVIEREHRLVACTVWAQTNLLIAGKPVSIHYAQGLRVRDDMRGEGLGDLVRRLPSPALRKPSFGQVMFMRIGNAGMAGFLEAVKFQADSDRPQMVVGVTYLAAREEAAAAAQIRPIAESDLAHCAALINRTHAGLDLFAPYSAGDLKSVLDEGFWGDRPAWRPAVYGWNDLYVLEEGGAIVACAGLWDRGRDMRERWRSKDGETRLVEVAAALDLGCAAGRDDALARLLRHLAGLAAAKSRQSLIADLEHLPAVRAALADLEPRVESRTLEWSPYAPALPATLGECFIDLRYW
ncbi:MAG TPA: hypothetical protein VN805_04270 [Caulobacteraceae bacterium]|nr:hypothetical protein [Caulobacteraceae bacterium]